MESQLQPDTWVFAPKDESHCRIQRVETESTPAICSEIPQRRSVPTVNGMSMAEERLKYNNPRLKSCRDKAMALLHLITCNHQESGDKNRQF